MSALVRAIRWDGSVLLDRETWGLIRQLLDPEQVEEVDMPAQRLERSEIDRMRGRAGRMYVPPLSPVGVAVPIQVLDNGANVVLDSKPWAAIAQFLQAHGARIDTVLPNFDISGKAYRNRPGPKSKLTLRPA